MSKTEIQGQEYFDLETVARKLGCHKTRLLKAIDDGELTAVEGIQRGFSVRQEWIDAFVARRTVNADADNKAGGDAE